MIRGPKKRIRITPDSCSGHTGDQDGTMTATENMAPVISEPLTCDEICENYPDEWVCLVEIGWIGPHNFMFRTARVVGHGKTRLEPLDQARPWRKRYKSIGHYFTGHIEPSVDSIRCRFVRVDLPIAGSLPRFYVEVEPIS